MHRQRQTIAVATPEVVTRLKEFERALKLACDECGFSLIVSNEHLDVIHVLDRHDARPGNIQKDWPHVASFTAVDSVFGVFNIANAKCAPVVGFDLSEYQLDEETIPDLEKAGLLPKGLLG